MLRFSFCLHSVALAVLVSSQAQAQQSGQPLLTLTAPTTLPTPSVRPKTIALIGRVETTTGVLPGAVVEVKGNSNLRAVTDADGFFRLVVPTTTSPVPVSASYAGYDDVAANLIPGAMPAVLRLVVPHDEIKLPRKQQLPAYIRTAHKQIKQQLQDVYQ